MSRRSALVGLAVTGATAAGCTPYTVDEPAVSLPTPSGPRGVDRDVLLAQRLLEPERAMVVAREATVRRHPRLAGLLTSGRAVHDAHVALLEEAVPDEPSGSPSPAGPTTSAPVAPVGEVTVPGRARAAVAAIARAEDRLAVLARRSAFAAESGSFARVLASMAAAATQQGVLLRGEPPGEPSP